MRQSDFKKEDKGTGRLYEQGRSTKGWRKGQKITSISELIVGMIVIKVSHQFKAENLVVISPVPNEIPGRPIRYCRYVKPDGTPTWDGHEDTAIWDFEVAESQEQNLQQYQRPPWSEFFLAVPEPSGRGKNATVPAKKLGES